MCDCVCKCVCLRVLLCKCVCVSVNICVSVTVYKYLYIRIRSHQYYTYSRPIIFTLDTHTHYPFPSSPNHKDEENNGPRRRQDWVLGTSLTFIHVMLLYYKLPSHIVIGVTLIVHISSYTACHYFYYLQSLLLL